MFFAVMLFPGSGLCFCISMTIFISYEISMVALKLMEITFWKCIEGLSLLLNLFSVPVSYFQ